MSSFIIRATHSTPLFIVPIFLKNHVSWNAQFPVWIILQGILDYTKDYMDFILAHILNVGKKIKNHKIVG